MLRSFYGPARDGLGTFCFTTRYQSSADLNQVQTRYLNGRSLGRGLGCVTVVLLDGPAIALFSERFVYQCRVLIVDFNSLCLHFGQMYATQIIL